MGTVMRILIGAYAGLLGCVISMVIAGCIVGFRTKIKDAPLVFCFTIAGGICAGLYAYAVTP